MPRDPKPPGDGARVTGPKRRWTVTFRFATMLDRASRLQDEQFIGQVPVGRMNRYAVSNDFPQSQVLERRARRSKSFARKASTYRDPRVSEGHPPTREELQALYHRAGISPGEGLRAKEPLAVELGLTGPAADNGAILDSMIEHPILIERPLVETPKRRPTVPPSRQGPRNPLIWPFPRRRESPIRTLVPKIDSAPFAPGLRDGNLSDGRQPLLRRGVLGRAAPARAIIPLDNFHVSRSLKRVPSLRPVRQSPSTPPSPGSIAACAMRDETWINSDIEAAMLDLHRLGHAHSIEVWAGREGPGIGRRPLWSEARPGLLRREHVQPRDRCLEGRARLARRPAEGRRLHLARLPVHDRSPRLAGRGARSRANALLRIACRGARRRGSGFRRRFRRGRPAAGAPRSPANLWALDALLGVPGLEGTAPDPLRASGSSSRSSLGQTS
jgi:arsenate reductase-like glutaredoxin family protein